MKRNNTLILAASTTAFLTCLTSAQDNNLTKPSRTESSGHDRSVQRSSVGHLNDAAKASDLIGMAVQNYQGEKLGKVNDLAVDMESGRIVQVIVSTGGFIGIGDTLTAVPPGALHHDVANKILHLNADKDKLKGAPKFEHAKWAENFDQVHLSEAYSHYGEAPALSFIEKGDGVLDDQIRTDSQRNQAGRRNSDGSPKLATTGKPGVAWEKDRLSTDRHSMIPVSRLGQIQRVSKVLGLAVKNVQDEKLGSLENILVDLASGRIVAVVVSSGGFLGMGDELSAVPPTALRFNHDRNTFQLDTTKEMLSQAPHFKANQWPDFAQPGYASEVYRAYQLEPYFTPTTSTDADNTGRNVRDRNSQTLTPLDQGNSKEDVATTAEIRKGIIGSKNMSINARNVKIITLNGRVTLRGPVSTSEEKLLIGEIAERVARAENVDNQLEVKQTTSSNN